MPAHQLRQALAELQGLSEVIVRAFIVRRRRLRRKREFAGLRILSQDGQREGRQLDDFLDKNHIPHRLINSQSDAGRSLGIDSRPVQPRSAGLILANGVSLRHPSLREVARVAGLIQSRGDG